MEERKESLAAFGSGVGIFAVGLAKKVLLANNIGLFWDTVQNLAPAEMSLAAAWCGIVAFGLQLYFDFAGYSDMAVGLGRMLGFEFERNFSIRISAAASRSFGGAGISVWGPGLRNICIFLWAAAAGGAAAECLIF